MKSACSVERSPGEEFCRFQLLNFSLLTTSAAQVVETPVIVIKSRVQDYSQPDNQTTINFLHFIYPFFMSIKQIPICLIVFVFCSNEFFSISDNRCSEREEEASSAHHAKSQHNCSFIRFDEGLTLETSALKLFTVANLHHQLCP